MAKKNKEKYQDIRTKEVKVEKEKKQKPKKKKMNGCLKAIIVCLTIFVILTGAIIGGAYWAWGNYVEPETNLSFGEGFKLIQSLYSGDEKKCITKPFDPVNDKNAFYTGFKKTLFLADSVDLTISDVLSLALAGKAPEGSQGLPDPNAPTDGGVAIVNKVVPTSTGNAAVDKLLNDINFDFSTLADYEGESDDYFLDVTDVQLAAILNEAFGYIASEEGAQNFPQIAQYQKYIKHVNIGQVQISSSADGLVTDLELVLKIKTKDLMGDVLPSLGLPSFVNSLISMVIPKEVFVGMKVYPHDETKQAEVIFNQLDANIMKKVIGVVDKVMSDKSGTPTSYMTTINNKVVSIISGLQNKMPIYFRDSKCQIQPITGMMSMLGVTELTDRQFLYMIRDIKVAEPDDIMIGTSNGTQLLKDEARDTAVDSFITSFTEKIAFNNIGDDKKPIITADNVFTKITDLAKDETMLNRINFAAFPFRETYDERAYKIDANYLALAGLLNNFLAQQGKEPAPPVGPEVTDPNVPLAGEVTPPTEPAPPAMKSIPIKILTFGFNPKTNMIKLAASIEVQKFISDSFAGKDNADIMIKFANQLLPANLFIAAELSLVEDPSKPTIVYINKYINDADVAGTTELLNTITKILSGVMKDNPDSIAQITNLPETLAIKVRAALAGVNEKLGSEIIFEENQCLIPSLFEIVAGLGMFKDETTQTQIVNAEGVHNVFKAAYQYSSTENIAADASSLSGQMENKLYLKNVPTEAQAIFDKMKTIKDTFTDDVDVNKMVNDVTPLENLKPFVVDKELAYLINGTGKLDGVVNILKNIRVINSTIAIVSGQAKLDLEISGEIFLEGDNAKYAALLPDKIYVQISVDGTILKNKIETGEYTPGHPEYMSYTKLTIDNMDDATLDTFLKVVSKINNKPFSLEETIKSVQDKIESTLGGFMGGGDGTTPVSPDEKISINFEDGKLILDTTIFNIAVAQIFKGAAEEEKVSAVDFRSTLQEIYKYTSLDTIQGTDASALSNEFAKKLYIEKMPTDHTIFDELANLKNTFADKINVQNMISDTTPLSELQPQILDTELGYLINGTGKLNGVVNVLKNIKVINSKITDDLGVKKLSMEISGEIFLEGDNAKYAALLPQMIYVQIDIDCNVLKSKVETGYYEGNDATYRAYTSINIDKMNDTQKSAFVKLVSKVNNKPFSLDETIKSVQANLEKTFASIIGSQGESADPDTKIPLVFEAGILKLGTTIYNIAVGQIFKDSLPADKVSADDFRGAMQAMYTPIEFTNNIDVADISRVETDEILSKYYVDVSSKTGSLQSKITGIKDDFFTAIRGDLLATDIRTPDMVGYGKDDTLNLVIRGGELGKMLSSDLSISINGISNLSMQRFAITSNNLLEIIFKGDITKTIAPTPVGAVEGSGTDPKSSVYDKMLPDSVVVKVTIDKSKLATIKPDYVDPTATVPQVNGINQDNMDVFKKLYKAMTKKELNLTEANETAARKTKQLLDGLEAGVDLKFVGPDVCGHGDGVLTMSNIFELARRQIYNGVESDVTATEIQSTLKKINNVDSLVPTFGATATDQAILADQVKLSLAMPNLDLKASITDANILNKIGAIDLNTAFNGTARFKQVALISKDGAGENQVALDAAYGVFFKADETSPIVYKDSLVMTINLNVKEMLKQPNATIIPAQLDVTLIVGLKDPSNDVTFRINTLNAREDEVLNDLFGAKKGSQDSNSGLDSTKIKGVVSTILKTPLISTSVASYSVSLTLEQLLGFIFPTPENPANKNKIVNDAKVTSPTLDDSKYFGHLHIDQLIPISSLG